ncbi:hypothetical protein RRG08_018224 [Elysia crispata]|uniref:Uncharacterized protein n=1 Tax=Elysia crispata TaxID=231223 RepID=A0AAE0YLR3_9GAST|nr:hypothetical protein RRG08_018224 [Elysia crispata]
MEFEADSEPWIQVPVQMPLTESRVYMGVRLLDINDGPWLVQNEKARLLGPQFDPALYQMVVMPNNRDPSYGNTDPTVLSDNQPMLAYADHLLGGYVYFQLREP